MPANSLATALVALLRTSGVVADDLKAVTVRRSKPSKEALGRNRQCVRERAQPLNMGVLGKSAAVGEWSAESSPSPFFDNSKPSIYGQVTPERLLARKPPVFVVGRPDRWSGV
jgi:hypothetical protein